MSGLRVIVVGLGVQGYTSAASSPAPILSHQLIRSMRKPTTNPSRMCRQDAYDAALCCIPDAPKVALLNDLIGIGKHVLVEKPLWAEDDREIEALEALARDRGVVCYTAYNHRFEPHYMRMRDLIASGDLGRIYRCRMFYGNGTARLVRDSAWRDHGSGVLHDLGSHLLDTAAFWFGQAGSEDFVVYASNCFENRSPDHVVIGSEAGDIKIELEMTLAVVAQSLHLRPVRRKRIGAYLFAVQMGPDHLHPAHTSAAERAAGGRQ